MKKRFLTNSDQLSTGMLVRYNNYSGEECLGRVLKFNELNVIVKTMLDAVIERPITDLWVYDENEPENIKRLADFKNFLTMLCAEMENFSGCRTNIGCASCPINKRMW